MKKRCILLLVPALVFTLLAGCGGAPEPSPEVSAAPEPDAEPTAVRSEWSSEGGAYIQSAYTLPGDGIVSVSAFGGEVYTACVSFEDRERYRVYRGTSDIIWDADGVKIDSASAGEAGIWTLQWERGDSGEKLVLISFDGEVLASAYLGDIVSFKNDLYTMRASGDTVYIKTPDELGAVGSDLTLKYKISLPKNAANLAIGGDGTAYLAVITEKGNDIYALSDAGTEMAFSVSLSGGGLYSGNDDNLLLYVNDDGIFGVSFDGNVSPVVIWDDCYIATASLASVLPLSGGRFLLVDMLGESVLTPTEPENMRERLTLTLGCIGEAESVSGRVMGWNITSSESYIAVRDYGDGGERSSEEALKSLNMDIMSGKGPDMLLISGLPVGIFISRGVLDDLTPLLEDDTDISLSDISIAEKLSIDGGIYFLSGSFTLDTCVGRYDIFGSSDGWTPEDYLALDAGVPAGSGVMYGVTRQALLRFLCERYVSTAIDWENATCDFDNPEFISLLETCSLIREIPEPEDALKLSEYIRTYSVESGTLCAKPLSISSVWTLKELENRAGQTFSVIGTPTADGRGGTEISLRSPVGICSTSEHPRECWSFIRYLLLGSKTALPVYAPYLEEQRTAARSGKNPAGLEMTEEEIARFDGILAGAVLGVYDETALAIIEEEAAALFAGDLSPEETAKRIQSRAAIYVAEQG